VSQSAGRAPGRGGLDCPPTGMESNLDGQQPALYQQARPTDLRRATPWHRYAHHIRTLPARLEELAADLDLPERARILDYGCADVPYRGFFPAGADYVAADLKGNPHATLVLDPAGTVPVEDESFDAVVSTQVLEHVTDPALYLSECRRVLRPGGRLLLSTHGIFVYHPDPDDYWRWTCAGLQRAVREAGFEVDRFDGIIGPAATGLQLFQDAFYYELPRVLQAPFALVMQTAIRLVDRIGRQRPRHYDAQVFALIARRP
jgi:SAM-dependent methyltransferase